MTHIHSLSLDSIIISRYVPRQNCWEKEFNLLTPLEVFDSYRVGECGITHSNSLLVVSKPE